MIIYNKERRTLASLLAGGFVLMMSMSAAPGLFAAQSDSNASLGHESVSRHIPHPRDKTFMKRQWGIEVLFVRQTSAGYMLEFRYKVLDAEKAMPLFERQTKPVLTHAESGAKMIVPTPAKTGALRNSNPPHAGKTYWMFFANPGKLVRPGDLVDIDIGDFRANGIVVQ